MQRIIPTSVPAALCLLWIALLAPAAPAAAQFGAAAGPSLADLFGPDVQSAQTRSGLTGGGSYALFHLGPVAISPELFYAPKGAAETQLLLESPEFFEELGVDYVEVPILARMGFGVPGTGDVLRASVAGGPAFAWKLNCSVRMSESGRGALNDECLLIDAPDARTVIASADQGLVLGGGLDLDLFGFGALTLDLRTVRGLARVGNGSDGLDARNRTTSLTLGLVFGPNGR